MRNAMAMKEIKRALLISETMEPGLQPSILMNKNINHELVAEYAMRTLGEEGSHAHDRLVEHLNYGWIVFRIQTELDINGHKTVAYLAKMKAL